MTIEGKSASIGDFYTFRPPCITVARISLHILEARADFDSSIYAAY